MSSLCGSVKPQPACIVLYVQVFFVFSPLPPHPCLLVCSPSAYFPNWNVTATIFMNGAPNGVSSTGYGIAIVELDVIQCWVRAARSRKPTMACLHPGILFSPPPPLPFWLTCCLVGRYSPRAWCTWSSFHP
jgi:hypothetical protein